MSKRIESELEEIIKTPPENVSARPIDKNNLNHWTATIGSSGFTFSRRNLSTRNRFSKEISV